MKKMMAMTALIATLMTATSAMAEEYCGTITSHPVTARCAPGRACPLYVELRYALTNEGQSDVVMRAANFDVLEKFGQYLGSMVCVEGEQGPAGLYVNSVTQVQN